MKVLLQGVPEEIEIDEIEAAINMIENVSSNHHTHVWSFDGQHHVLTTHIVVEPDISRENILCIKEQLNELKEKYNIFHTTLEIEYEDEKCSITDEQS